MKKIGEIFIGLSLVLGAAFTCLGLLRMPWPSGLPWANISALTHYMILLIGGFLVVATASFWSGRSALFAGFILAVLIALLSGNLWPLIVSLWFIIASALLGKYILTMFHIMVDEDSWLISFLAGAGTYGTLVGLLAHFPVNYPGLYGIGLALPVIFGWRTVLKDGKKIFSKPAQNQTLFLALKSNIFDAAITAISLVYFVVALMPELGYDALAFHLFVPGHLATRHAWGFDAAKYVWATWPMLGDWFFSIGYMLAGETGARIINVVSILTLTYLVRKLVLWAGGSIRGAKLAMLIFLSTPLAFTESSSLYIDSIWSLFVVAGTWMVIRSCSGQSKARIELPLAGLFLGFALSAKAVTFSILPILFLIMALRYKTWRKSMNLYSWSIAFGLFFVLSSIPYITSWVLTGNPIFPFLNAFFKSPYYITTSNFDTTAKVYGQGITWDILYKWTFEAGKYLEASVGAPGFQWLLLFLPAGLILIVKKQYRAITLFSIAILIVVAVFHSVSYLRYVFPAWVMLPAAIGVALSVKFSKYIIIRVAWYLSAAATVLLNLLFLEAGAFYRDFPLKSIVNEDARAQYLINNLPIRYAVKVVNDLNVERFPVAVFAEPRAAGLASDALYPAWYNWSFQKEIIAVQTENDALETLTKRGVNFIILDSGWQGRNCCADQGFRQILIENITDPIAQYNSIAVRKIKSAGTGKGKVYNSFKTELLVNTDFASPDAWSFPAPAKYDSKENIISASVDFPVTQYVNVTPGKTYLYTVVARSTNKEVVQGRKQINWMDKNGKFISTTIQVFNCSPTWGKYTMEATAPLGAFGAVVYLGGHSSTPVEFKSCSLRE